MARMMERYWLFSLIQNCFSFVSCSAPSPVCALLGRLVCLLWRFRSRPGRKRVGYFLPFVCAHCRVVCLFSRFRSRPGWKGVGYFLYDRSVFSPIHLLPIVCSARLSVRCWDVWYVCSAGGFVLGPDGNVLVISRVFLCAVGTFGIFS